MKIKILLLLMMFVLSSYLASAQGLSVEPKTNIKVLSGTTLKISSGDLILKSDATGDATVIAFGSITHGTGGKAIVQRYIPGFANAWHMVSAPVNGMAITESDWETDTDEDLYLWDEPDPGTWVNYKNTTVEPTFATANPGDNFVTGRGYIANYNTANPTNNFESTALNSGNININLAYSAKKNWTWTAGQNLIGNPYPSGLDWSAVTKTDIVTETYASVYNPNKDGGPGYDNVNGIIAPGQGFFVQAASSDGAVLALKPSQQVHVTDQSFLKQGDAADRLVLRLSSGQFYDETKILLNEASVPEHDFYDATKYFSFNPQVPQLYSLGSDGWRLAINSMEKVSESLAIPVSVKVQGNSLMSIDLIVSEGVFDGPEIFLHDVLTNTIHKLSETPSYNFMANEDDHPDRFLLKFAAVGVQDVPGSIELNAYMAHSRLYVLNPDAPKATVELYNIQGKVILREKIGSGLQSVNVHIATGIYLVVMYTENAVTTRKLFIQQ